MHRRGAVLAGSLTLVVAGSSAVTGAALAAGSAAGSAPVRVLRLQDPQIAESSGLARSSFSDRRLWTHNDSGGGPYLYAIGARGQTTERVHVRGAVNTDWEAVSHATSAGVSYLFAGDIGDNHDTRSTIAVYRLREPKPGPARVTVAAVRFRFKYPDGAHNAEGLMVRPGTMRIYIVSKGKGGPGAIYAAPRHPSTKVVNRLTKVTSAPEGMSDATFLGKQRYVLRGYNSGWLYAHFGAAPIRFPLPIKGESITKAPDGHSVYVGAEGVHSPVWRVPLP